MMNLTATSYPFYSYVPSRISASIFAIIVFISLISWFIQSLHVKCRPRSIFAFVLISHLTTFIELVLRAALDVNRLNTTTLYKVTAPLISVPPRLLLFANYHCLVELRGKKPHRVFDRVIDIVVPIGGITVDILLAIANELSFKSNHLYRSFYLRQASAGFLLCLTILFYVVWYFSVSHARRQYVLPLLSVSSICVFIEAIYILAMSIPSLFFQLTQSELWFYAGHLIPIVLALISWSIFHPSRLLPPPETAVPHNEAGEELLPPPQTI
ncbi:unnamed protein product [Adineta steineri]|uniref:Uncharacterized protein n=1 Tax=Adineta steineri TaxID=433720 RepID=A0A814WHT1_9BILA|nr:unnamed protein product [Adineta steineri]CAF1201676.1 unnamed protein product [Adineta steineri]